ncbi:DUF5959 family protein [Streptosporangium pseudovulgare]|uniref:Uncharacterized protein n=1 Tax=Streptosporangium pseudovulgare TaxID=35765 RepID=A0ABQ2QQP1_9ACTN|nr:DUF5959 family protein [Streptosporangium pseudovulgare]GGP92132.1 hypothetical protein GCM10010140_22410 [Streptosporangium pseudovulgare]
MGEFASLELVRLGDDEAHVVVQVKGQSAPSEDVLDARILVASEFMRGELGTYLLPDDLDQWVVALDELAAGRDVCWMDDGRAPEIEIRLCQSYGGAEVWVKDHPASLVWVRLLVRLEPGWIENQRSRLRHVRQMWLGQG